MDKRVTRTIVHEIAHHFGYSDEEIHAIEDEDWGSWIKTQERPFS